MAGTRRTSWVWIVFTAVIGAVLITAATIVTVRLTAQPPAPTVSVQVPATLLVDGTAPPAIPVPAHGSFALATSLNGTVASRDPTSVRPIGSVAKAMTALVVLAAHPLDTTAAGPSLTMTNEDVLLYRQAVSEGGSNLPVRAGEVLTERDLLLALLLPSADNIAESLALWVSGNRSAFINRLNATAAAMGMNHTHFADPSGLSVRTVSTAADLVVLARAVIANPALASVVGTSRAVLPDGTVLKNLDILLTTQAGWLGIKTGWTGAAGGCLLFADRNVYETGTTLTVWGAVLGQPPSSDADPAHPELGDAFASARNAVVTAIASYASVDLASSPPQVSGSVTTAWGPGADVQVSNHAPEVVFVRAGAQLQLHLTLLSPRAPMASGTTIAEITGLLNKKIAITWQVITASAIASPSVAWKLFSS
jgi:D-alanyl-D-alanine carboxypeptidase (penicillin-binding protein 5/6)